MVRINDSPYKKKKPRLQPGARIRKKSGSCRSHDVLSEKIQENKLTRNKQFQIL